MFAVLYLPDFPLQAVLRTEPGAGGEPAALFTDNTKKSLVLAANALARHALVEVGMAAPQAVARCPRLLIRTPNRAAETEARAALLAVGFTLAPRVEDTSPGVCTIDLKGSERSAYERAAHAAVAQLRTLGFLAAAGLAATPLLALYAARQTAQQIGEASAAATTNEDDAPLHSGSPSAVGAATRGSELPVVHFVSEPGSFLAPLPWGVGDPSPEIAGVLTRWGLRTFGDLTALSRDDIGRRLGPEGLALWDRARGGEARPLRLVTPPQNFVAGMEFEEEVETLDPLLFMLRRFLERLAVELRAAGFVAASLDLTLGLSDGGRHGRSFRLPEPTADVEILFRTLHTHLDALRTESAIASLALELSPTRPLVRQHGLFDTGLRDPHGFGETLARTMAIVGADRVGTPQSADTHRPDAVTLATPAANIPAPEPRPLHPAIGLPLRRFRPPLPAQFELTEGKPTYLWTERFHGAVAEVRGPWQSSGDWWQADRAWRRTEYDIAVADGGLYRVVFAGGAWSVEGEYD